MPPCTCDYQPGSHISLYLSLSSSPSLSISLSLSLSLSFSLTLSRTLSLSLSLSRTHILSLSVSLCSSFSLSLYFSVSLSPFLSLYIHICNFICIWRGGVLGWKGVFGSRRPALGGHMREGARASQRMLVFWSYQRACKYHANTHHALSSVHQSRLLPSRKGITRCRCCCGRSRGR